LADNRARRGRNPANVVHVERKIYMKSRATTAASRKSGRLSIFALGLDNQMFHKSFDNGKWDTSLTEWEAIGGRAV
jgi:hypothetical protein